MLRKMKREKETMKVRNQGRWGTFGLKGYK